MRPAAIRASLTLAGMSLIAPTLLGVAILAPAARAENHESGDACLTCHLELEDDVLTPPAQLFAKDVHRESGFTCASCHGGDPQNEDMEESMSPEAGFIGVPDVFQIPGLCARCHADENVMRRFDPAVPVDQEAKYRTSGHGRALIAGDANVAQCVSCHGAHGILKVTNPGSPVYPTRLPLTCDNCHGNKILMSPYGIDSDPYDEFAESVHGQALLDRGDTGAPACNDCHGSHGAAPPGVDAVHFVCGTCHLNNREEFEQSPHVEAFAKLESGECVTCHGYHSVRAVDDAMLGVGERGMCRKCHVDENDPGRIVAARLGSAMDSLITGIERATELTERAEQLGMLVDDSAFQVRVAREHLVKIRTASHAASFDAVAEDYREGLAAVAEATTGANASIEEFHFRRRGFIVATLLNTILIGFVVLSIRRLARRPADRPGQD